MDMMTMEHATLSHIDSPTPFAQATSKAKPGLITILEPSLSYGFTQLPRPVLKARGLSRNAKTLYALLLDYAWQSGSCFPGQARLADDLDISVDSVRRDLDELRQYGLITWQRRPGLSATNIYYIRRLSDCEKLALLDSATTPTGENTAFMPSTNDAHVPAAHAASVLPAYAAATPHKQDSALNKTQSEQTQQPSTRVASITRHKRVVAIKPKQNEEIAGTCLESATDVDAAMLALMPEAIELIAIGWQRVKAVAFVERYGEERVSRHLEALHFLQRRRPDLVRDPAAWVRRAIEEDWPTPTTLADPPRNAFFATSQLSVEAPIEDAAFVVVEEPIKGEELVERDTELENVWQAVIPRLRPALNVAKTMWLSKANLRSDDPTIRDWIASGTPIPATHHPRLNLRLNRRWQLNELAQNDRFYVEMLLNDYFGASVNLSFGA